MHSLRQLAGHKEHFLLVLCNQRQASKAFCYTYCLHIYQVSIVETGDPQPGNNVL